MKTLWLWLLLVQTVSAGHDLVPGTVVSLAAPELFPVYSSAVLEDHRLVFNLALEPETEVRLLIDPPGTEAGSTEAPYGRIGPTGDDIFVQFEGSEQAVSFRKWLADEHGVELTFVAPGD